MLQTLVRGGHSSADSSLQHNAWKLSSTTLQFLRKKPAITLVFLMLTLGAVGGVSLIANESRSSSTTPNMTEELKSSLEVEVREQQTVTNEQASDTNTSSVEVETKVQNGVPNARVEVNGQELPVKPNTTTTHVTNQNGSQSTTSITNHTSQTGDGSFNSSTNTTTSTSSSQSVNNSSTWEGN